MQTWLHLLANAILAKTGKTDRLDTATRMAMDADFSDRGEPATPSREPRPNLDPLDELERILRDGNRCVAFSRRP
jgi:hypothetical protein